MRHEHQSEHVERHAAHHEQAARHAVTDLCQVYSVAPRPPEQDRLPPEVLHLIRSPGWLFTPDILLRAALNWA